jgi:membrane-associated phospholipid phosphatase
MNLPLIAFKSMKRLKIKVLLVCSVCSLLFVKSYSQVDSLATEQQDPLVVRVDTLAVDTTTNVTNSFQSATISAGKQPIYKLKPAVDIPLSLATAGWSLFAFTKIYSKDNSSLEEIQSLRISDINSFDRWAADVYSEKAADNSDLLFYGSMPLPLLFLADNKIRKDFGKISFLYFETMSLTGLLYTGSTYFKDRYRPYAYNPNMPIGDRLEGNAKNSFFAGHVALVATSTFFMAKVFSDYHPDSNLKYLFYGAASAATGVTAYLRHKGGRHFPSDIILGTVQGTLTGILVPHFHKNKLLKKGNLTVVPFTGNSHGLYVSYKL